MRAAKPIYDHERYWAECYGTAPFLPMSSAEMDTLGWDSCDVIIVTGDAYVDHPSFGMAIIGRLLPRERRSTEVAFQVIHADQRQAGRVGQRFGQLQPDQQRAG